MKWFLILLAIGLAASDKLDRTYLPPPGAQFAGGSPGDIQAPLELPNLPQSGTVQLGPSLTGLQDFGANGQTTQLPVTTTSYAFTQTTTYPPIESYETTVIPVNPVTGLPVQNVYQPNIQNLPGYTQSDGQFVPSYNTNLQTGYAPQGTTSDQSVNIGNPTYTQTSNQPGVVIAGGDNLIPVVSPQQPLINEGPIQYPGGQMTISNQYPNQNLSPGGTVQISGSRSHSPDGYQDSQQYTSGKITPGQQGLIQSTISPQKTTPNTLPGDKLIEIGHKGPLIEEYPQGTYSGQPINVQDEITPQLHQNYENQGSLAHNGNQRPITENHNVGSTIAKNTYRPVQEDKNGFSTTPVSGLVSSTSAYSSTGPIIRPERPQAAGDRNAVIINYENVRTPNSYFYSYDTSNGIHADERGTVDDGTKAQGAYSYIGDDGKVYSVVYTADENGFQPHGDHIPTAPPIPEAIQKVIEQAARDKAAGIVDDGSYDEAKYGHQNYQSPVHHRRPQIQGKLAQKDKIRPISSITENDYDEILPQNQFKENFSKSGNIKPIEKHPLHYPSAINTGYDDITGVSNKQYEGNENPSVSEENFPGVEGKNKIQQDEYNLKRPSNGVKGTKTQYPGTIIEDIVKAGSYPDIKTGKDDVFENGGYQNIEQGSPEYYSPDQSSENLNYGSPIMGVRKQESKLRPKGSRRPSITSDQGIQIDQSFKQGDLDDFVDKQTDSSPTRQDFSQNRASERIPSQKTNQQIDENGYFYDSPRIQFGQSQLPSRFKEQEKPSISTIMPHKDQSASLRPFQTPDVYNQPSGSQQTGKQYGNQQSTTPRPFMTSSVTTPKDNSYTDYDDAEDYGNDQDINGVVSTTRPDKNVYPGNRRISQPTQTTSRPQYTPFGQRMRITEKGTVAPNQESDYYNSVSPDYNYGSTTPLPPQSSRFGTTQTPKKTMEQRQRRPSTSRRPGSSTAVGRPVLSSTPTTETPVNKYTTSSSLRYPSSTTAPVYSSNRAQPGYDSRLPNGQTGSTPQNYPTYTTTSGTAVPTTSGFQPGSGAFVPSDISSTYQPSTNGAYQTRQENEPVQYSTTGIPQTPAPTSFVPGTYATSTPGYYQTTYQENPNNRYTTVAPSTSVRPGSLISSRPATTTSGSTPTGPYQTSYQYTSPTANYATTSTPGTSSNVGSPIDTVSSGSYYSQPSPSGYQYGSPGTVYSATGSPSTYGTRPGSFTSSTSTGRPYQEYATTLHPTYPTTQGTVYSQSPVVDGFGRPIMTKLQPGYPSIEQELGQYPGTRDGNNFRGPGSNGSPSGVVSNENQKPMYGADLSSNYPGYYGQPQVIGEDFSGPKQPQRFDPQTGYHY